MFFDFHGTTQSKLSVPMTNTLLPASLLTNKTFSSNQRQHDVTIPVALGEESSQSELPSRFSLSCGSRPDSEPSHSWSKGPLSVRVMIFESERFSFHSIESYIFILSLIFDSWILSTVLFFIFFAIHPEQDRAEPGTARVLDTGSAQSLSQQCWPDLHICSFSWEDIARNQLLV